jgi:hypothetical protein
MKPNKHSNDRSPRRVQCATQRFYSSSAASDEQRQLSSRHDSSTAHVAFGNAGEAPTSAAKGCHHSTNGAPQHMHSQKQSCNLTCAAQQGVMARHDLNSVSSAEPVPDTCDSLLKFHTCSIKAVVPANQHYVCKPPIMYHTPSSTSPPKVSTEGLF